MSGRFSPQSLATTPNAVILSMYFIIDNPDGLEGDNIDNDHHMIEVGTERTFDLSFLTEMDGVNHPDCRGNNQALISVTFPADKVKLSWNGQESTSGTLLINKWLLAQQQLTQCNNPVRIGSGCTTITVEAIAPSADLNDIVITARTIPPPNVEGVPCNDPCEPVTLKLTAYVQWIKIAIDATNTGDFNDPTDSEWENFVKDHDYGVGKVILPNHGDCDSDGILDCWDGFSLGANHTQSSPNASAPFVPITISIPAGVDVSNLYVRIKYPGHSTIDLPSDLTSKPTGNPGYVRIWTKNGDKARDGREISAQGGDFVPPHPLYEAALLGFSPTNHTITLYVEGLEESNHIKYYNDVKTGPKQNDMIEVFLLDGADDMKELGKDKARYVVANRDTFYYQMVRNQDLRAAVASAGIYGNSDLPQFGLQIFGSDPLTKVDMHLPIKVSLIANQGTPDGFNAGVYFDFCSRKYLVAFEGTTPTSIADWWNNARQFMIGQSSQYKKAMAIGIYVNTYCNINKVIFTGHSLGGGLASATTIFAIPENYNGVQRAYTFNASALQAATVEQYKQQENIQDGGRAAYNYGSKEQTLVLAYIVRGELLDTLQSALPDAPPNKKRAFGGKQQLEHNLPLNSIDLTGIPVFADYGAFSLYFGVNRIRLHAMEHVLRGLERLLGVREP